MFKRHNPSTAEEQEMMENLFDALCSCLMLPANRDRFLRGEGLQLMNLMLRYVIRVHVLAFVVELNMMLLSHGAVWDFDGMTTLRKSTSVSLYCNYNTLKCVIFKCLSIFKLLNWTQYILVLTNILNMIFMEKQSLKNTKYIFLCKHRTNYMIS